ASPTYTFSPYLQIAGTFDRIRMQAGLKYFHMKEEKSEGYFWNATIGDLQRAPDLDRKEKSYEIWLPSLGVSYSLNPQTELYLSYGKTFIRPYNYLPLVSLYHRLRGNFTQAGITLADLFEGLDIERADVIDLGLRIKGGGFDLNPTIFYSYHKKLLTNVSDPRVRDGGRPVSYRQNVGKARGFGLEVITNIYLSDNLFFFLNPTYQKVIYAKDISFRGVTYNNKGKQVVDVPRFMLVGGMSYRFQNFFITPKIKYMGKRYGTITHEEKVSSYTTVDLTLGYQRKSFYSLRNLRLSLEFNNLFDKKYISHISAFDDDTSGVRYAVGSPFTVRGGLSFEF
ncbi:MAG: TonB-dependent receptor, partial [Caldimicrobium sp.]|nr:TonB-dependent receptor [Caldimicrobium sp.]